MSDPASKSTDRSGLNPKLKAVTNTSRDTETPMRPPAESASVQYEEGRSWPMIWLVVTLICIAIGIYLIVW
jgi:hypothetical protein